MHQTQTNEIHGPPGMMRAIIALAMLALPLCASATLGGNTASTETDRASMDASLRVLPNALFSVHEIQTASGTKVREFVSPAGSVFAVAWEGPVIPDLRQTLGSYFDRYVAALAGKQAGHRQVEVREADFVVQSRGHMRAFSGRAYLPLLMPEGVTVDDLR